MSLNTSEKLNQKRERTLSIPSETGNDNNLSQLKQWKGSRQLGISNTDQTDYESSVPQI